MRKKLAIIAFLLLLPLAVWGTQSVSTINPMLPAPNTPLNNAVVQTNFQHAYNDINYILSILGGLGNLSTLNSPLLPVNGGTGRTAICPSGQTFISTGSVYTCITIGGGGGGGLTSQTIITTGSAHSTIACNTFVGWNSASGSAKTETIPASTGSLCEVTISDIFGDAYTNPITPTPVSGPILGSPSVYTSHGSVTLLDTSIGWVSI